MAQSRLKEVLEIRRFEIIFEPKSVNTPTTFVLRTSHTTFAFTDSKSDKYVKKHVNA